MLLIREHFTAKPGNAGKLAALMKDALSSAPFKTRVMTDVTGAFNQVVMDREKTKGYADLYLIGGREIFRLW